MGENAPLRISVIINNYNYARYVGRAIQSVLDQTYDAVECIVVDDGSTDASWEVISGFSGITAIRQSNGGQTAAAIRGLAESSGRVVLFLDADDSLAPQACAEIARAYDPAVSLYQFGLEKRDAEGQTLGFYPNEPFVHDGHRAMVERFGFIPSSPTSGNAFSRSHCETMFPQIKPSDRRHYFDGFLIFSAPFFGRVVALDQVLGFYLIHGANVSAQGRTVKALRHNVHNALWQRTSILLAQGKPVSSDEAAMGYLSPYHLRNALIVRKALNERVLLPGHSAWSVCSAAIMRSLRFPYMSLAKRATNIAACLFVLLAPRALVTRVYFGSTP